jgi:hypothetical protein
MVTSRLTPHVTRQPFGLDGDGASAELRIAGEAGADA